jgi:hypothetical protein
VEPNNRTVYVKKILKRQELFFPERRAELMGERRKK